MFQKIKEFFFGKGSPSPLPATEQVAAAYKFPFTLRKHQQETVDMLANYQGSGCYMGVGTGKTAVATFLAFYHGMEGNIDRILVVMPPILLIQWKEWFDLFPELETQLYMGTKAKREQMPLNLDVTLMSFDIFKNDNERIRKVFRDVNTFVIVDEASKIRRVSTLGYKAVRDFIRTGGVRYFTLLSGTPINAPIHAYAYVSLVTPEAYKNLSRFKLMHVAATDIYDEPSRYKNLDMLKKVLYFRSVHIDSDAVLDLPEVTYDRVDYNLETKHQKLYDTLVEEKLVELDEGIIDGTTPQRLYQAVQKIILLPALYGGEKIKPHGFELIDTMIADAGIPDNSGEKLIIYAHYQDSNEAIFKHLSGKQGVGAVQAYGKIGAQRNMANIKKFLEDPNTNILVANARSVGIGLNLQSVCRMMLFIELPITADDFIQAVGRIKREGQTRPCLIRFGVALNTIQQELARRIARKEDVAQQVMPTIETLRSALFGG